MTSPMCSPGAVPEVSADLHPAPGAVATCEVCGESLVARCGERTAAHWAHRPRYAWGDIKAVDRWWLSAWQAYAHPALRDVEVGDGVAHLLAPDGTAVMFVGPGGVSPEGIRRTEAALGDVTWIVDARSAATAVRLGLRTLRHDGYATFRWYSPMRVLTECRAPVYLDMGHHYQRHPGGDLLKLGRLYLPRDGEQSRRTGGWGHVVAAESIRSQIAAWSKTPTPTEEIHP